MTSDMAELSLIEIFITCKVPKTESAFSCECEALSKNQTRNGSNGLLDEQWYPLLHCTAQSLYYGTERIRFVAFNFLLSLFWVHSSS